MIRRPTVLRVATILLVVLSTAGTKLLPAQQPGLAPVVHGSLLSGPRLKPELRSFEPSFADSRTAALPLLASSGSNHTFVFSTLALVLIGVIIVLLVV
jgi:hypothetical protein